jgi:hypothetical protein
MNLSSFKVLVTALLILQNTTSFAQRSKSEPAWPDSDPQAQLQKEKDDQEALECLSSLGHNLDPDVSVLNDIDQATLSLNTDGVTNEELKAIYQKNGCNADAVDQIAPEKRINPLLGFSVDDLKKNPTQETTTTPKIHLTRKERLLKMCRRQKLMNDIEGCQPVRAMHTSIQDGSFNSATLQSVRRTSLQQNASTSGVTAIASLVVSAWSAYTSHEAHELQKKQYEEQKTEIEERKRTEQATETQNRHTTADQSKPQEQAKNTSEESKQPDEPQKDSEKQKDSQPAQKPIVEPIGEIKKFDPDITNESDEYAVIQFEDFSNKVEDEVKTCDQMQKSRMTGTSLAVVQNQNIVRTLQNLDAPNGCDSKQLNEDLLDQKRKLNNAEGIQFGVTLRYERNERERSEKQRKLRQAFEQCSKTFFADGSTEKEYCREIRSAVMGQDSASDLFQTALKSQHSSQDLKDVLRQRLLKPGELKPAGNLPLNIGN